MNESPKPVINIAATILFVFCLCLCALVYWIHPWTWFSFLSAAKPGPIVVTSTGLSVERIQVMAQLVNLKISVADVIKAEQVSLLTTYKGVWIVKGDALYTTNLKTATISEEKNLDGTLRRTIHLERPHVTSPRVDHQQTHLYDFTKSTWVPWPFHRDISKEIQAEAFKHAEEAILLAVDTPEHQQQAQERAEETLKGFCRALGTEVQIEWRNQPSTQANK